MNTDLAPHHHPDQFLMLEYAAGALPGAVALPLAVHLEYCQRCRVEHSQLDQLGAQVFEALDPVPVATDALSALMQRIDAAGSAHQESRPRHRTAEGSNPGVARALRPLLPEGFGDVAWQHVTGSLRAASLAFGDPEREVSLQHIRAGGRVPSHDHGGTEITVVLQGCFADQDGHYQPGDFMIRGPGEVHRPTGDLHHDCICLAVLDAPIRLRGLSGLLANPFLRIRPR